jgi:hypothetical protein
MNEIATAIGIRFIYAGQALDGGAERGAGVGVSRVSFCSHAPR